jgi:hypothetical protein
MPRDATYKTHDQNPACIRRICKQGPYRRRIDSPATHQITRVIIKRYGIFGDARRKEYRPDAHDYKQCIHNNNTIEMHHHTIEMHHPRCLVLKERKNLEMLVYKSGKPTHLPLREFGWIWLE